MDGLFRVPLEMFTQPPQEVIDRAGLGKEFESPYVLEQLISRHDRAVGLDEFESKFELKRRELDPTQGAMDSEAFLFDRPR